MLRTGLWPAYSTFGPKIILAHQTELILIGVKLIIKHGVNHSLPTQHGQRSEKAGLAEVNLITLTIMLGTIAPTRLKNAKLLAIALNTCALATSVTGNV